MGKLKALKKLINTRTVDLGDATVEVRGLSYSDLSQLAHNHLDELKPLFAAAKASGGDEEAVSNLVTQAIVVAPEAAAEAILLATGGDAEDYETIRSLPAVYQTALLGEVVAATLVGGVALEKMVGALSDAMGLLFGPMEAAPPKAKKASKGGSSGSAKKSPTSSKKATRKRGYTR